jgi:hypothetical protein
LAIDEAARRLAAVRFNAHEQARLLGVGLVMWERLTVEEGGDALTPLGGIRGFKAGGERPGGGVPAQSQHLRSLQQKFNGPAQPRPKLDLPSNGAFDGLTGHPRV